MKKTKDHIRLLFIGNSHTYYNDLPYMVSVMVAESGVQADVTMIAHGGWYLKQHAAEPDVLFNIKYGNYDYVILQEHSHPFDHLDDYEEALRILTGWIREAGSVPVIYGTWSMKSQPEKQEVMNQTNRTLSEKLATLYAPVGESWWAYQKNWPQIEMYDPDGGHASRAGSEFAAKIIWSTILTDFRKEEE